MIKQTNLEKDLSFYKVEIPEEEKEEVMKIWREIEQSYAEKAFELNQKMLRDEAEGFRKLHEKGYLSFIGLN